MSSKPSILKGTRDFSSNEMQKRNYLFDKLKKIFYNFSFEEIQTPSIESLDNLTGQYGVEGDKLIFKILKSGNFLSKSDYNESSTYKSLALQISDKALRYDLTVPFARYVAQHRNNLSFPFRRFQIQNVWRADKPQKGRFREFFQCDADIIGTKSLIAEHELLRLYDTVFDSLGLTNLVIKINHRKILTGISQIIGEEEKLIDITVAIDKIDKIGLEKAKEEMYSKGISKKAIKKMDFIFGLEGSNLDKISVLRSFLSGSSIGIEGLDELSSLVSSFGDNALKCSLDFDFSLARGLNYYTGTIFEVKINQLDFGSLGGGGRYDDLTGIFGLKDVSGVGISFGFDRIFMALEELDLFPDLIHKKNKFLFINFGEKESTYCLNLLNKLRNKGIQSEIYPDFCKVKKQMQYAAKKDVKYVLLVGENEIYSNTISVKNMYDGTQKSMTFEQLLTLK